MYLKFFSYSIAFIIGSSLMYYYKEKQIQNLKIDILEKSKIVQENVVTIVDNSNIKYKVHMKKIDNINIEFKNNILEYLKQTNMLYEKYKVNNL